QPGARRRLPRGGGGEGVGWASGASGGPGSRHREGMDHRGDRRGARAQHRAGPRTSDAPLARGNACVGGSGATAQCQGACAGDAAGTRAARPAAGPRRARPRGPRRGERRRRTQCAGVARAAASGGAAGLRDGRSARVRRARGRRPEGSRPRARRSRGPGLGRMDGQRRDSQERAAARRQARAGDQPAPAATADRPAIARAALRRGPQVLAAAVARRGLLQRRAAGVRQPKAAQATAYLDCISHEMRSVTVHSLMRVANRLQGLAQSEIRRMTRECERVGGINLGQGICDLPTPPLVRDGAIAAIRENRSTYSFAEGARELRDAIARKLARDNGLQADPATEICVTVGASGAYTAAIHALLDAGDGILLFAPYYGHHLNAAVVAGLTPEFATLRPPEFTLREDALEAAIT